VGNGDFLLAVRSNLQIQLLGCLRPKQKSVDGFLGSIFELWINLLGRQIMPPQLKLLTDKQTPKPSSSRYGMMIYGDV
jgi:hypothetical protein